MKPITLNKNEITLLLEFIKQELDADDDDYGWTKKQLTKYRMELRKLYIKIGHGAD